LPARPAPDCSRLSSRTRYWNTKLLHLEESLDLLDEAERRGALGDEDTRERLEHQFRCWILSSLDRFDQALQAADDGVAAAERDRQDWAVRLYEKWRGRQLLQMGRFADASAALEARFTISKADLVVESSTLTALPCVRPAEDSHGSGARGARDRRDLQGHARCQCPSCAPARSVVPSRPMRWRRGTLSKPERGCAPWVKTQRLSIFPLFPLEIADVPQLVRVALAAGDQELVESTVNLASRLCELKPRIRSFQAASVHARGLARGPSTISKPLFLCSKMDFGRWRWRPL